MGWGGEQGRRLRVEGREKRRWKFLLCRKAQAGVRRVTPPSCKIRKHNMENEGWDLPWLWSERHRVRVSEPPLGE